MPLEGAQGSVLKDANMDLIAGLRDLVAGHLNVDGNFDAGNIMLGGDGDDLFEGRGGDDLIDGDKWLNVRISVRANADGTGAQIATYDSLEPLLPLMLNGTYNPGQLVIVLEILTGHGAGDVDTARYLGNQADYEFQLLPDDVMIITDTVGRYRHALQCRAGAIRRRRLHNNDLPIGVLAINGLTLAGEASPTEGLVLTASIGSIEDGDGMTSSVLSYRWQALIAGVWTDIPGATARPSRRPRRRSTSSSGSRRPMSTTAGCSRRCSRTRPISSVT